MLSPHIDQATRDYGSGVDLCGPKTYQIYEDDQITPFTEPFLTLESEATFTLLTLQTDDPIFFTNSNVQYFMKITLDDYVDAYASKVTLWEPFLINI